MIDIAKVLAISVLSGFVCFILIQAAWIVPRFWEWFRRWRQDVRQNPTTEGNGVIEYRITPIRADGSEIDTSQLPPPGGVWIENDAVLIGHVNPRCNCDDYHTARFCPVHTPPIVCSLCGRPLEGEGVPAPCSCTKLRTERDPSQLNRRIKA